MCDEAIHRRDASKDEHRVAERVEAVALGNRQAVELAGLVHSGEGHDERQQRRARQVEVRQQGVDAAELEARRDEEVGAALERRASRDAISSTRTVVVPTASTRSAPAIRSHASGRTA